MIKSGVIVLAVLIGFSAIQSQGDDAQSSLNNMNVMDLKPGTWYLDVQTPSENLDPYLVSPKIVNNFDLVNTANYRVRDELKGSERVIINPRTGPFPPTGSGGGILERVSDVIDKAENITMADRLAYYAGQLQSGDIPKPICGIFSSDSVFPTRQYLGFKVVKFVNEPSLDATLLIAHEVKKKDSGYKWGKAEWGIGCMHKKGLNITVGEMNTIYSYMVRIRAGQEFVQPKD